MAIGLYVARARNLDLDETEAVRAERWLEFDAFCHRQQERLRYRLNRSVDRITKAKFGDDEVGVIVVSTRGSSIASSPVSRNYLNQSESDAIRRLL